jgi:hypothetical protein
MKYVFIIFARDNNGTEELYVGTVLEYNNNVIYTPNQMRSLHVDEMDAAEAYLQANGVDIQAITDYKTENGL